MSTDEITKGVNRRSPRQQGWGALAPAPNLQRGPEISPVRADFTHQECAPPPPPPRGGCPRCRQLEGLRKYSRGAPPGCVTTLPVGGPSTDRRGQDRARGGSHAPPPPPQPRGRPGPGRPGDAEPARGLTPGPAPSTKGGAFPLGFPNPFPSLGGARGQRPCQSALGRKREPPLPSCPGAPSSRARPYLQLLGAAAGAGLRASRPISPRRRQKPEKYGGGSFRPAEEPLSWGAGNREEASRQPLSRTPPPHFCLDGCSREPAPQLPFSPSLSPRSPRLLLPLLPPAPGPPCPAPPPACRASWRHAHRARARGSGTCSFAYACPPRACLGAPSLRAGWPRARTRSLYPARGSLRPFLPLRVTPSWLSCGAGVSCKDERGWLKLLSSAHLGTLGRVGNDP
ncbi:basic proline-rich protein-like [Equus asinus]|uniref:basic proline-rich protein-like n=1 Tax=Equus asinus TaxID=9793 RepID=UPI0038F7834E